MMKSKKLLVHVVAMCIAVMIAVCLVPQAAARADDTNDSRTVTVKVSGTYDYAKAYEVLALVNKERAAEGLDSLVMDKDLLDAAMQRAAEINLYYEHTRPDGSLCFTASAKMYGENIAVGYSSASAVMNGWMNSEGHKENIMNSSYVSIGIGCFSQGGYLHWVQCFGYDSVTACTKPSNKTATASIKCSTSHLTSDKLSFDVNSISLKSGESRTLQVTAANDGWSYDTCKLVASSFSWKSSDKSVATVSSGGKVTWAGGGSFTVTASIGGNSISVSGKCENGNINKKITRNNITYQIVSKNGKNTATVLGMKNKTKTALTIPATVTYGQKVYKVTSIKSYAFKNNQKLKRVVIGKNVSTVGTGVFYNCRYLKTLSLGSSTAVIGDKAFYNCRSLAKLTIPVKVKKMGKYAFAKCVRLKSLTIKTTKLTSKNVGAKAFASAYARMTVKVPKGKVTAYRKLLRAKGASSKITVKKYN